MSLWSAGKFLPYCKVSYPPHCIICSRYHQISEACGGAWLRHCATSQKVVGSIPHGVNGIFHWRNPSCRTVALIEVDSASNRNEYQEYFLGDKGGRWCIELTTLPPSCADCLEIWKPQTPGTLRACPGLWWDCFTFFFRQISRVAPHCHFTACIC
jgi:hypothetical protein